MELPTGPAPRAKARWPWVALTSVFVLPVVGAALGVPLGEWLAVLSGERQIPEFWLRGEKPHFSAKPKDPLGPLSPGSLAFIAKEAAPPPPEPALPPTISEPAPSAAPAGAGSTARRPALPQKEPPSSPPLFRPPRLRNVAAGGQVVSWFQGSETTRRAESRTDAFVAAEAPKAEPKPPAPQAPPPAEAPKAQPKPPPPAPRAKERRRIAGRATPGTVVGPAGPVGEQGPGPGGIALPAPDKTAPPPNPSQTPPAPASPKECLISQDPASGVRVSPVVERYPVSGSTYDQLAARLAQETSGGRHGPGRTTGEVKPQCRFKQEGHLCTPLCSVSVETRRRLPLWDLAGPAELIDRWTLFAKRVSEHELSHEALFVREGNELLRRLDALERTPCKDIRASVDSAGLAVRDEFRKKHREYDAAVRPVPRCRQEL